MIYKTNYTIATLFTLIACFSLQAMEKKEHVLQQPKITIITTEGASFPSDQNKIAVLNEVVSIIAGKKPKDLPAAQEWFSYEKNKKNKKLATLLKKHYIPLYKIRSMHSFAPELIHTE